MIDFRRLLLFARASFYRMEIYMDTSAIVVAAGTGSRMGAGMNKVYMPLGDKCVLWHTVAAICKSGAADEIVVVTGAEDFDRCRAILKEFDIPSKIVEGGATRQQSVMNGLSVARGCFAAVHDGARALITPEQFAAVVADAKKYGAASLGVPPKDTIKTADENGIITGTVARQSAYLIQTPQVFLRADLLDAHNRAMADGYTVTDDCMLMEREGVKIKITEGSYENIKLTTPEDIFTAEKILEARGKIK